MKRREFVATAAMLAAGTAALLPATLLAQAPLEGKNFVKLGQAAPTEAAAGKIEVLEFFWYNCPHCSAFEPVLAAWAMKLPKDVVFRRVPIAFRDDYVPQQKLYYALEAMGLLETLHAQVFSAIHGQRQNLVSAESITEWVVKQGVDRTRFVANFSSFSTGAKASRARQLMTAYQIEGVPAVGVAGRFYTDGSMAGSMNGALNVADFLIALVRAKPNAVQ